MDDLDDDHNIIDFLQSPTGKKQQHAKQTYAALNAELAKINQEYSFILHGGATGVLREEDTSKGAREIHMMSKDSFMALFANKSVPDPANETKRLNLGYTWWSWEKRREYRKLVFIPGLDECLDGEYNLWTGFSRVPDEAGDCSLFLDHVRTNICAGSDENYHWLMCWLACMIQRTGRKTDVALVLRSEGEGTGKGFFAETIGALVKRHYMTILNPDHLTGKFNSHLANKILIFVDEAFCVDDKKTRGILYGMVTGNTIPIEFKGKDIASVDFYARLIIASNHNWVVPAGKDARRWAVFDVAGHAKQNKGYFGEINNQLENGGYEKLMHTLLHWEITEEFYKTVPQTGALLDQKISSFSSDALWWYSTLYDGALKSDGAVGEYWPVTISKTDLYNCYLAWCKTRGVKKIEMDTVWARTVSSLCNGLKLRRNTKAGNVYDIPALDDARLKFEAAVGQRVEWGDE